MFNSNHNKLSIGPLNDPITLKTDKETFTISKVNQSPTQNDIILFTDRWGPNTLTPFKNRREISCDQKGKIIELSDHGNIPIPPNGFVISIPDSAKIDKISTQDTITLDLGALSPQEIGKISAIMGIPQLIKEGKIEESVLNNRGSFYTLPHSRTAVGLKKNGEIVLVVAEHVYKKDPKKITLEEVRNIIQNNKIKISSKYMKMPQNLTVEELKKIVRDESSNRNGAIGLTLPDLSKLMMELGCESAINLDGGGSSTLWIDGKVVNQTIGDEDEGAGQSVVRFVSDALVFRNKISK